LCDNFAFSDTKCVLVSKAERERWKIPFIIQGRVFTKCLLLAMLFFATALIMPSVARAQSDDFIPNIPAWDQPIVAPFAGDGSRFRAGDIPFTYLTVGANEGDRIFFDIVVDTGPFDSSNAGDTGSLWLSAVCSNCSDMKYLAPTDGTASPDEQ